MGYLGKLEEKKLAINLRKKGWSYTQIKNKINVSKSTLSLWCRDVILTVGQLEYLANKKLVGSQKGRFINSKKQQEKRKIETGELFEKGKEEIGRLFEREKFLIGVALYAAEGTKSDRRIRFCNSDPRLIKFMVEWMRRYLNVPDEKLRGSLWIHENSDIKTAKQFWSDLINIPENQFYKVYIAKNKANSKKIRKKIHPYGVFSIGFTDAQKHRKLMGWIGGIA